MRHRWSKRSRGWWLRLVWPHIVFAVGSATLASEVGQLGERSARPVVEQMSARGCRFEGDIADADGLCPADDCPADESGNCCRRHCGRRLCNHHSFLCGFGEAIGTHRDTTRYFGDRPTLLAWTARSVGNGGPPERDEPLATDRPDFTEASVTVGRRVAQIELGYTYVEDRDRGERTETHSLGEPLLRVGLFAEWLELRLGWTYVGEAVHHDATIEHQTGAADLVVGLKLALTPQDGVLPETALIAQMTVPSGSDAFGADGVGPGVIWIYAWELNDRLSTAGSTQGNRVVDGATRSGYLEIAQSWTVGLGLTERLSCYVEWFAMFPHGADTERARHFVDGGFAYLVSNDLQLDIRAGVGLNEAADDFFAGSGVSIRF